jgi:hypothetical protein
MGICIRVEGLYLAIKQISLGSREDLFNKNC